MRNKEYKKSYIEGLILYLYDVTTGAENELIQILKKLKSGILKIKGKKIDSKKEEI